MSALQGLAEVSGSVGSSESLPSLPAPLLGSLSLGPPGLLLKIHPFCSRPACFWLRVLPRKFSWPLACLENCFCHSLQNVQEKRGESNLFHLCLVFILQIKIKISFMGKGSCLRKNLVSDLGSHKTICRCHQGLANMPQRGSASFFLSPGLKTTIYSEWFWQWMPLVFLLDHCVFSLVISCNQSLSEAPHKDSRELGGSEGTNAQGAGRGLHQCPASGSGSL